METVFYIAGVFCLALSLICYGKYVNREKMGKVFHPRDVCDESPNAKRRALLYFSTAGLFATSGMLCNIDSKIGTYLGIVSCFAMLGIAILSFFMRKT